MTPAGLCGNEAVTMNSGFTKTSLTAGMKVSRAYEPATLDLDQLACVIRRLFSSEPACDSDTVATSVAPLPDLHAILPASAAFPDLLLQ
jgi:hypothetical protein